MAINCRQILRRVHGQIRQGSQGQGCWMLRVPDIGSMCYKPISHVQNTNSRTNGETSSSRVRLTIEDAIKISTPSAHTDAAMFMIPTLRF